MLFIRPNDADLTGPDCCGITLSFRALRIDSISISKKSQPIAKSARSVAAFSRLFCSQVKK